MISNLIDLEDQDLIEEEEQIVTNKGITFKETKKSLHHLMKIKK